MLLNDAAQAIISLGVCATVAITVVSIGQAYVQSCKFARRLGNPISRRTFRIACRASSRP
jgi:hypothetical protein